MADQIARLEAIDGGLLNHTDGSAFERLADLERRDVAQAVDHAAAHIGIDRHPERCGQELADSGSGEATLDKFKILRTRQAGRAALQMDFAGCNGHGNLLYRNLRAVAHDW